LIQQGEKISAETDDVVAGQRLVGVTEPAESVN
jgi:hypothetical protein